MAKEIERAGIPTVLITAIPRIALQFQVPRILRGIAVTNPVGEPAAGPQIERARRRRLIERALAGLQLTVTHPTLLDEQPPEVTRVTADVR